MSISLDHIEPSLRSLAVPIVQITSDPKNARQHSPRNLEIIKTSLARFRPTKTNRYRCEVRVPRR